MHELSIAHHLVEVAGEAARRAGAERVVGLCVKVGQLSCVHREALEFCFDVVTQGTILEGARLTIVDVPVEVYCAACHQTSRLESIQRFCCGHCGRPTADVRQGKELELDTIEVATAENSPVDETLANGDLGGRLSAAESPS